MRQYSRPRNVIARVDKTLNKIIMPNNAPNPIQYQYDPVKYPIDSKTLTPRARDTFPSREAFANKNQLNKTKNYDQQSSHTTHMFPLVPSELVHKDCIISIHHRKNVIAP